MYIPKFSCTVLWALPMHGQSVACLFLSLLFYSCTPQDWHVDFAGSSVYYHVLRGSKVYSKMMQQKYST